jgi:uncharacterized protein (DUF1501 family)
MKEQSRRDFLVRTTCAALSASAIQSTVRQWGLANLLATPNGPNTLSPNYRALVCVFLNGGSDTNNMIIPLDGGHYATYQAARPTLAIPQGNILPMNNPPSMGGQSFGWHPNLAALRDLYNANKLAVVTNVGPLVVPTTQAQYIANSVPKPYALFSHSDQIQAQQTGRADIKIGTGWGGRAADAVEACNSAGGGYPTITSISGSSTFCVGLKRPLSIGTGNLNSVLTISGFSGTPESNARRASFDYLRTIDATATMIAAASGTTQQALDISTEFASWQPADGVTTVFPNTGLGNQLKQVANVIKLVSNSPGINLSRQIFFVSQGGYDTHQDQIADQGNNFLTLSPALLAFYNATIELGLQDKITAFTLSDFGRTLQESGDTGGVGTDHGWGGHQVVIGGSVAGGNFYGTPNGSTGSIFPTMQVGGPDDTTTSSNGRGRWIPTTASEQYGAALAKWFGVSDIDMPSVFPRIGNFGAPPSFLSADPPGC